MTSLALVIDPSNDPAEEVDFAERLRQIAVEASPRLFAVLSEHTDRDGVSLVAWGMEFADHVEAVSSDGSHRMSLRSVERVRFMYADPEAITHFVWFDAFVAEVTE
ncbi:hypothetical protein SUDANB95_05612 [Actinosynnema sp. ALI-1.44]|uniref:Uncharacterized protein n=1 Tax=Saccharothrix mutabilis subsp. mutabilis TaxID=66855 RepID=A0ABN0U969_9PSEU